MYQTIGKYAGNVFDAEIQGLDYENFYDWQKVVIRSAPVVDATTGDNMSEDWQRIMIIDRHIDFIPTGAYVKFNNNIWIVFNPENVASDIGTAVVQRCNTTYNTLDWYGNVVKTPMSVSKGKILASSPYYMEYSAIMDGYGHILIQYNEATKDLHDNTRVILGNSAYSFYGVVNYAQEFTGNEDSVHIIKADLRVNEIAENDDRENRVADGNVFRFEIEMPETADILTNRNFPVDPVCRRNGEVVTDTQEHPIDIQYFTSDSSVATAYDTMIHGEGPGSATITAVLLQNDSIRSETLVTVSDATTADYVSFVESVPTVAPVFSSFTVWAIYYEDGEKTAQPVSFRCSGVPDNAYTLTENGDNTATIDVWTASGTLTITAYCNGYEASTDVFLEGF